jgi:hypothetical protein
MLTVEKLLVQVLLVQLDPSYVRVHHTVPLASLSLQKVKRNHTGSPPIR